MSIAILNDPQLSTDVYDLLISQTTPSMAPSARDESHDIFTTVLNVHSSTHQRYSPPMNLLVILLR
ncbi:hypothetical protein KIN20_003100 [Parelaphostrongylus tenuis]|uniref:Uncharacterized protein n=1 Tax=Parelaphostrongylus tenuis TaxID=148309 RepID=A0AAD5QH71_PARTN|nr:hypothetical protein KIN20_003100 [Parelaphostrongylus tenuis]